MILFRISVIPSVARNLKCYAFVIWAIEKVGKDEHPHIPSPLTGEGWGEGNPSRPTGNIPSPVVGEG